MVRNVILSLSLTLVTSTLLAAEEGQAVSQANRGRSGYSHAGSADGLAQEAGDPHHRTRVQCSGRPKVTRLQVV